MLVVETRSGCWQGTGGCGRRVATGLVTGSHRPGAHPFLVR